VIIISSVTDIRTYVANANPGGVLGDDTLVDGLVEAIRAADDRPAWGQDWEEWLDANTGRLARDVYESTIHVGDWVVADGRPEDRDYGHIVSLDGDMATVAWVSGSTIAIDLTRDDVEVYAEYSTARARHEALDRADEIADDDGASRFGGQP
jgi:hypothetical protein